MMKLNKFIKPLFVVFFATLAMDPAFASLSSFKTTIITDPEVSTKNSQMNGEDAAASDVFAVSESLGHHRSCNEVATPNDWAEWGKIIDSAFSQYYYPHLIAGDFDQMNSVCPNYRNFPIEEKISLWALVLNELSFYETTCDANPKKKYGPNGQLRGAFQLHAGHEAAGDGKKKICKNGDSKKITTEIPCVLSMLDNQLDVRGQLFTNHPDPNRGSYWDVMRIGGDEKIVPDILQGTYGTRESGSTLVKAAMKRYKGCFTRK